MYFFSFINRTFAKYYGELWDLEEFPEFARSLPLFLLHEKFKEIWRYLDVVATPLIPALGRLRQVNLYEFSVSLAHGGQFPESCIMLTKQPGEAGKGFGGCAVGNFHKCTHLSR